jgi:hypothetical protein
LARVAAVVGDINNLIGGAAKPEAHFLRVNHAPVQALSVV